MLDVFYPVFKDDDEIAYSIFPKSWLDMIPFLIHHLRINTIDQLKLFIDIKKTDPKV